MTPLFTVWISDIPITLDLLVKFRRYPAQRGYREPGGGQIDPDEPERVEIESVETGIEGGYFRELTLSDEDLDRISKHILLESVEET